MSNSLCFRIKARGPCIVFQRASAWLKNSSTGEFIKALPAPLAASTIQQINVGERGCELDTASSQDTASG